jgi:alkylmercury lyase
MSAELPSMVDSSAWGTEEGRPIGAGSRMARRRFPLVLLFSHGSDQDINSFFPPMDTERSDNMNNIEQNTTADLADFLAGVRTMIERGIVAFAVIGLTNFGEYPAQSTRLAEILGGDVREAEALAQQWGWPGPRVEDGLISVDPERAKAAPRRHVRIGHRQFGVTGCAPDVFGYAPLVRPSLQLEETCSTTGTPIRLEFAKNRVVLVEPASTVLPILGPQWIDQTEGLSMEDLDANVCVQAPFFSSAEAAQGWLATHPGGRIFPVREAWDLSPLSDYRERMVALFHLDT